MTFVYSHHAGPGSRSPSEAPASSTTDRASPGLASLPPPSTERLDRPSVRRPNRLWPSSRWHVTRPTLRNSRRTEPKPDCGPIQDGAPITPVGTSGTDGMGRRAAWRGPARRRRAEGRGSTPGSSRSRETASDPCHVQSPAGDSVASRCATVRCGQISARCVVDHGFQSRAFLGPGRSRSRNSRGRGQGFSVARSFRFENSGRKGVESRSSAQGPCLARQVPRASAANPAGDPNCARLRLAELEETRSRCQWD